MISNKISCFSNMKPMLKQATMVGVLGLASIAANMQGKPAITKLNQDSYTALSINQQEREKQKEQKEKNLITILGASLLCLGFASFALAIGQALATPPSNGDTKK